LWVGLVYSTDLEASLSTTGGGKEGKFKKKEIHLSREERRTPGSMPMGGLVIQTGPKTQK
jgi:hypothetical protein